MDRHNATALARDKQYCRNGDFLKINYFCLHFYTVFSRTMFAYICTAKVCLGVEHVHHIEVTSHFAYAELWITRSIFAISFDFDL